MPRTNTINVPVIFSLIAIIAILAFFFWPRAPIPAPCIQIPKELSGEEEKKALDMRSQLEAAVEAKGDVVAKYGTVVQSSFAKLSDRNMTLYIFVQAISCYLKNGDAASQEVAKAMTELLRAELARGARHGDLRGPLTAEEKADIQKSRYADLIWIDFQLFSSRRSSSLSVDNYPALSAPDGFLRILLPHASSAKTNRVLARCNQSLPKKTDRLTIQ